MSGQTLDYNVTFRDFQFMQGYMARRVFARNRRGYVTALAGVVLCATLLGIVIFANANPYRVAMLFGRGVPYPISFYLFLILCLVAAILCLLPAVRLRLKTLRMQVSDDGPFLGPTKLIVEDDGLIVDRAVMRAKYLWAAFQGVEIAKNAVILPVDNGIGVIIPAAAFASDAERFEFVAMVAKRIEELRRGTRNTQVERRATRSLPTRSPDGV